MKINLLLTAPRTCFVVAVMDPGTVLSTCALCTINSVDAHKRLTRLFSKNGQEYVEAGSMTLHDNNIKKQKGVS
ncbi:MAG: hypothetical protein ACYC7D_04005 [Nitrososphaerales archaeon]